MYTPIFVVIPVYNAEKYLECTVRSVLDQPNVNTQVVLVNDGSRDSSGGICDELCARDKRICVIHQENGGVSKARNTGIEAVLEKTKQLGDDAFVAFLDADDFWKRDMQWMQAEEEDADIIAYSSVMSNAPGKRFGLLHRFTDCVTVGDGANTDWLNYGLFAAYLYRADFLRKNKLRFLEGVTHNEDVIFWRQATFCARKVVFCSEILYVYRMHSGSVMHRNSIEYIKTLHIPKAWNRAIEWIHSLPDVTDIQKELWTANCNISTGAVLLENARKLAEYGYSAAQIKAIVLGTPLAQHIDRLTVEGLAQWQKGDLVMFRENFEEFVRYHKKRGLLLRAGINISKLPIVRKLYENRKYNLREI